MPELLTFVETNVFTKRMAALGLEGSFASITCGSPIGAAFI
jgi:hypothetical protein